MNRILLALFLSGCASHASEHASNLANAAAYGAAVNKCADDAIATFATTGDKDKANAEYAACELAANRLFGKH